MKIRLLLPVIMLFAACQKEPAPVDNKYQPIDLSLKGEAIVQSSNQFGIDAFKRMNESDGANENVMISPLSITQALSMAWNGAKGSTLTEMSDVLNIDAGMTDGYNNEQKSLRESLLAADKLVQVDVANSIWYRNTETVLSSFTDVNRQYYKAEVKGLDFTKTEEAKNIINGWVNDKTHGKIPKIIDKINDASYMFVINAVYFLGDWSNQFDASLTQKENFTTGTGTVEADMMRTEATFNMLADENLSVVELPYGNGHFSMVLIMPANNDIDGLIDTLTDTGFENLLFGLSPSKAQVIMPKFKFAADYKLNEMLVAMGMPTAFTDSADFSGINGTGGILISEVRHKTYIDVNEKGTEAAAVTSIGFEITSIGPNQPVVMRFDKPFVFAIREKDTGAILFIGKMVNPIVE